MAKQRKDVRGIAKAQRESDRQAKKAEKLAKRRDARELRLRVRRAGGEGTAGTEAGAVTWLAEGVVLAMLC